MPIMSRPAPVTVPAREASPGQHRVTRPGVAPRVAPAAATGPHHTGHSIKRMDQQLDLFTQLPPPAAAEDRPWIYERVLAFVAEGRVWADNRRRYWLYNGGETTGDRMPTEDQAVLCVLQTQGHVRTSHDKQDMDVNDGRTLRVRRYQLTDTGTELHNRWAALSTYTA